MRTLKHWQYEWQYAGHGVTVVKYGDKLEKSVKTECGTEDYLHAFTETILDRKCLVVLGVNQRLGYAGIEVFDYESGVRYGDCFVQNVYDSYSIVYHPRYDFLDLQPINQAKALLGYVSIDRFEFGVNEDMLHYLGHEINYSRGPRE